MPSERPTSRIRRLIRSRGFRAGVGIACLLMAIQCALVWLLPPSNERDWSADQAKLPNARITGDDILEVEHVRHAVYRSASDYDARWVRQRYPMAELTSLWFIVEPFADWRGPAHTFLSFGFRDGRYLAVSVEIRKERGESFSPLKGMLRQFELMYVFGDERDLIGLRAVHRQDDVHLYPIRATPEQIRSLLESIVDRSRQLQQQPEMYHTITNNCTTNIIDHVGVIAPGRIGLTHAAVLPGYADDLAHDLGLIDTDLPKERYRAAFRINDRIDPEAIDDEAFSTRIRNVEATRH